MKDTVQSCIVPGEAGSLTVLFRFVSDFCDRNRIRAPDRHRLKLLVEELVANVISHGYDAARPGPIEVTLSRPTADRVAVVITDEGRPFDVTAKPPSSANTLAMQDRQLGGVGLSIVKSLAGTLEYRQENTRNVVRVMLMTGAHEDG